jgi:hypothetical protein
MSTTISKHSSAHYFIIKRKKIVSQRLTYKEFYIHNTLNSSLRGGLQQLIAIILLKKQKNKREKKWKT